MKGGSLEMMTDITKIQFESKGDIVDYVTRGPLPPKEEDFELLIDAIAHYDDDNEIMNEEKKVHIVDGVFPKSDEIQIFIYFLKRAYENRKRNRNCAFVFFGLMGSYLLTRLFRK